MNYWWVNVSQTYSRSIPAGFLWSPVRKSNGRSNPFWDNMLIATPGDVVFAYAKQQVKAIGIVQKKAYASPKPANFENSSNNWAQIGWLVEVEFIELTNPVIPRDHLASIEEYLVDKSAPLDVTGRGKERYLVKIVEAFAIKLIQFSGISLALITEELAPELETQSDYEIDLEIQAKKLEGDPEKVQLTKSRRGQGIFKANVRLIEHQCRVTGVNNLKHLRASHIKPWKDSNDQEKIDGNNGLLLSPHVDHLFDRGFISFRNNGDLLVSKELSPIVLVQWSLKNSENVGSFNQKQSSFLEFHRDSVFKAS